MAFGTCCLIFKLFSFEFCPVFGCNVKSISDALILDVSELFSMSIKNLMFHE